MSGPHFENWPEDEPLPVVVTDPQVTAAPIHRVIQFLRQSGVADHKIAEALGVSARNISKLLATPTLSVYAADAIACHWGAHPTAWWGAEWGNDVSEEDINGESK